MGRMIGIDLGTTNTVMAIREKEPRVLLNMENQDLTPSVVGVYRGKTRVGQLALDQMLLAPKDTIISVKRLMGRGFRDPEVQKVVENYRYEVVEPTDGTDDDLRIIMDGRPYSPIEISAQILKKIKEEAERRLNDTVEYAVITVPAYFTEKQKDATRKAGQLAGLKVQKILDEPTAAAFAFGLENVGPDETKNILVYDLGGGTFDVSVLTLAGGMMVQLDIEGDMWLGGDNFDVKIMDHVLRHLESVYGVNGRGDSRFMVELRKKAEQAKKSLSTMTRTDITIPAALKDDDGNPIDVELELSRTEFEGMIAKDVAHSIDLVRTAIRNAGEAMTPDQIDHVILVGGSSYIPAVQKALREVFGDKKVMMNVDAMKCVAYGAAVLSAKWDEKVECPRGHVNPGKNLVCEVEGCGEILSLGDIGIRPPVEVTAMHYGIQTKGDALEIIIPKGSSYPTPEPVKERFKTPTANMKRIRVPVYAWTPNQEAKSELQATVWLELPDHVPAATPLEVAFSLDGDGILKKILVALLDGSGTKIETFLDRGNEKRSRLEKKVDQLRKRRESLSGVMSPEAEQQWDQLYSRATKALSGNDPDAAQQGAAEMEKLLQGAGGTTDWKQKAQGISNYADVVLQYSFLLDPPRVQQLKTLQGKMARAIDSDNEAEANALYDQLDKATDDLPDALDTCMLLVRAMGRARSRGMEIEAEQIRGALRDIETALHANDSARYAARLQAVFPLLEKVFGGDAPRHPSKFGDDRPER